MTLNYTKNIEVKSNQDLSTPKDEYLGYRLESEGRIVADFIGKSADARLFAIAGRMYECVSELLKEVEDGGLDETIEVIRLARIIEEMEKSK